MNYAIQILEREKRILETCLSEGDWSQYTEAKKEREKRLKEINKAIELLKK